MKYRNTVEIFAIEKVFIDTGSLWERKKELMILVDDDRYITTPYNKEYFKTTKLYSEK